MMRPGHKQLGLLPERVVWVRVTPRARWRVGILESYFAKVFWYSLFPGSRSLIDHCALMNCCCHRLIVWVLLQGRCNASTFLLTISTRIIHVYSQIQMFAFCTEGKIRACELSWGLPLVICGLHAWPSIVFIAVPRLQSNAIKWSAVFCGFLWYHFTWWFPSLRKGKVDTMVKVMTETLVHCTLHCKLSIEQVRELDVDCWI